MEPNLYIICTVYNKCLDSVPVVKNYGVIQRTHKYTGLSLIIVDNSTCDDICKKNIESIAAACEENVILLSDGKNHGLSGAYNRALDYIYIKNCDDTDFWIMLADDDTDIEAPYIEAVKKEIYQTRCYMVSGIVKHRNGYMSPKSRYGLLEKSEDFVTMAGEYRNLYCINSGLTISKKVFDCIGRYDESLFVDMVDYWLMDMAIKRGVNLVKVLPYYIKQEFSGTEYEDRERVLWRFLQYKRDFTMYCKITGKSRSFWAIMLIKRRVRIEISTLITGIRRLIGRNQNVKG